MKILTILLASFAIISCSKATDISQKQVETHIYTLAVDMDNDVDCTYNIQESEDGTNFRTIQSFVTNAADSGSYSINLSLKYKDMVRLQIINNLDSTITASNVMVAD